MLSRRWVLIALLLCVSALRAESAMDGVRIYDDDPQHLWNRMHETLFVRLGPDGVRYGEDRVDPLVWPRTTHLLESTSHARALSILDEFLRKRGDRLVRDPLKRAFLQHDLWNLFDWAARAPMGPDAAFETQRSALRARLVPIIRALALSPHEIASLPDNYSRAIRRGLPEAPPARLFDENSEWIRIGSRDGTAPMHAQHFGGRSMFHVLMRVPGGRKEGLNYLDRLARFEHPWQLEDPPAAPGYFRSRPSRALPQFPPQTEWVLVRRMRVLDQEGAIRLTPIVQSIQLRRYLIVPESDAVPLDYENAQTMRVFEMSRARAGELIEVQKGARDFIQFQAHDTDPFEIPSEQVAKWYRDPEPFRNRLQHDVLRHCQACHADRGILSVNSLAWSSGDRSWPVLHPLGNDATIGSPTQDATIGSPAYSSTHEYGVLRGMWER